MAKKASLREQLDYYNLKMTRFCRLTGISQSSAGRYSIGTLKGDEIIKKIEIAADILSELNLVWPDVRYIPGNEKRIKEYEKNKKKAEKLDKKFVKAYEKALKKAGI